MFEGKLVRLRSYRKEDMKICLSFINDPLVTKNIRPGIPFPYKYEDEIKWYESLNPMSEKNYSFAIEKIEDETYLGGCGINYVDWKNSFCEIGLFLGKDFWNKGYGTDAMNILVKFIFNEMNLNKIKLFVYSFNDSARRVYEKLGFKTEGVLREEIYKEGKYYDEILMGLLKKDFIRMQETINTQ